MPGNDNSVSIIVSTLNEAENIAPLVAQIAATAVPFREILFVDNNSTNATRHMIRTLAATYPIRLIEQDHAELGLAAAVMSGALAAQGEVFVVMGPANSRPPKKSHTASDT
jgi:dolichol-phosphate mannosyltransferase